MALLRGIQLALICVVASACGETPPGRTYYERKIEPLLLQKCAGNTSGCHSTNTGDPFAIAAGNLDVTSFENVQKRRDALTRFGAYPHSLMLIKAVGADVLKMQHGSQFVPIQVQHSGGGILDLGSEGYFTLTEWLEAGATESGILPATPAREGEGTCTAAVPAGFVMADYVTSTTMASFQTFKSTVQPILKNHGCDAGSCHGAPQSDFFITCGTDDEQLAFNFSQAWKFVADDVEDSQLLRIPLAVKAGGRGHTGGDQFTSAAPAGDDNLDEEYDAIRKWAEVAGRYDWAQGDANKTFFEANVQRVLVQRGCAFSACHSPQAANDFKLRNGSVGFYSGVALERNYHVLRDEFMALEYADARRSRAVAKAILEDDPRVTGPGGIAHRGGPVLETQGTPADPAACPGTFDPATATAFCTLQRWLDLERAAAAADYTPMTPGSPISIVYVQRAAGAPAGRLEFDTFQGNAQLMRANTTFGANHQINAADAGAAQAIHVNCGLGGAPDIQAPDVANDGTRVAFAARASAAEPLGVYIATIDGATCNRITPAVADVGGIKIHNFDPAWTPDGSHLVFASTRGKTGPSRSKKLMLPQSDLWRVQINGTTAMGTPEQMTFLSNSEVAPQFMREGRVTMTTEKVSDGVLLPGQTAANGFYQLAGRRINWDRTDYHPLLAQRRESIFANMSRDASGNFTNLAQPMPSVGYNAATDIREGADGDFLLILSDTQTTGAPALQGGAGALAIFNRSIGPFEEGRVQDGYLQSLRILDRGAATGRSGATVGYRAPYPLPDGTIMVSRTTAVSQGTFEIVAVDPRGQAAPRDLFTNGTGVRVDAVLAIKHPPRKLYANRRQLVFGIGPADDKPDDTTAVLHMPDAPMVFTLLTANLRRGRPIDAFRDARYLAVLDANGKFVGRSPLADDGSVKVRVSAATPVILQLQNSSMMPVITMGEEHQFGPGEQISLGIKEELFDAVCGGCHGSISGRELDVAVTPDALTGASQSMSARLSPSSLQQ